MSYLVVRHYGHLKGYLTLNAFGWHWTTKQRRAHRFARTQAHRRAGEVSEAHRTGAQALRPVEYVAVVRLVPKQR